VTAARLQEARRDFEQALELDPESVDARTGIASVFLRTGAVGWSKSREQDMARADQLLREALERDGNDARAHFAMGWLRRNQNRFIESRIELEKTIALDRNLATAGLQLGWTLQALGEPAAAIPHIEKGLRLDPRSPFLYAYYAALGQSHLLLGHADDAVEFLRKAHAADPRIYYVQMLLAAALGLRGDLDEAKAALAELLKLKPELNSLANVRAHWPAHYGNPQFAAFAAKTQDIGLRRAGLPEE
jgi:tetratricopeptide (TPR) repeat protein